MRLFLSLLLLALVVGALLLLFNRPPGPTAVPGAPPAPTPPALQGAAPLAASAPAPPPGAAGAARTRRPAAKAETAEAGAPALEASEPSLLVEVVADGQPVPDGTLFVLDTARADEATTRKLLAGAQDALGFIHGISMRYRTGAAGQVRIPRADAGFYLIGEAPGLFGSLLVYPDPEQEKVSLHLEPERVLRAQVLDETGRPQAGVPVVLRMAWGPVPVVAARQPSDAEGRVVFRNFTALLPPVDPAGYPWNVAVAAPLPREVAAGFDLEAIPAEPFVLRLPPTGRVVVEVRDVRGRPVPDGVVVTLGPAEDEAGRRVQSMPLPQQGSALTEHGRAVFPVAGLGMDLRAAALLEGYPAPVTVEVRGPEREGAEVRVRLQPGQGPTWLTGRLLDTGGKAVAEARIVARLEVVSPEDSHTGIEVLETDAEGRFRLGLKEPSVPPGTRRRLTLARPGSRQDSVLASDQPRVHVDLAPSYEAGSHELGDLRLERLPLLASGLVLTSDRRPASSAQVVIQRLHGPDPERGWWADDRNTRVLTDDSGAFRTYGEAEDLEDGRFRMKATMEGYRPAHTEFVPGQTGVLLRLAGAGTVRGSVVLEPGIDPALLTVRFVPEDLEEGDTGLLADWEDNEFFWNDLKAGIGRVEILASDSAEPLVVVEDVEVVLGRENRDSRLQGIDLRGRLRLIRLEFVDEAGRPVREVTLSSLDPERGFWEVAWDGRLDLLVAEDLPPLLAAAGGYIWVRLDHLQGYRRIVLRQGAELEFILDNPPELEPGWFLGFSLEPEGMPGVSTFEAPRFDDRGRCKVRAPGAGTFRLVLLLARHRQDSTTAWSSGDVQFEPPVTIADPMLPATFHITLDHAKLADLIESVRNH